MRKWKITFNKINEINMTVYIHADNVTDAIVKFYLMHSVICDIEKIEEISIDKSKTV